ncbi:PspC domain-containing protein [uncultured Phycicoccus sp.]|uniref:PspC domain-containing protein n=1 Tax=uncultured Phycicoccus sp. TaxID=661422 RepID=UPI00261B5CAE|nr:PspC domain-containing protein [uncultured Phycicoccus sp.]
MTDTSSYGPPPPQAAPGPIDDALNRLRSGPLRRDTDRRWFGGVCAGIAARFDVDPLLIRAAAIALTIAGGLGIPVYLVLWLLLPDAHGTVLAERALRHGDAWPVVLGVVTALLLVGGLVSLGIGGDGWGGPIWLLIPVGLVVWLIATRARPAPPGTWPGADSPTAPPPPPGGTTMSAPTSSFAPAYGAAAAPTTPYGGSTPYAGSTPYGGSSPYGGPPAPPGPARPLAPPPPPAPRRRRPSGSVGVIALGLVILLSGLGTALAQVLGFPGEPAVLGASLALLGVSALVLGLGLSGRASGFSGFLVIVLGFVTVVSVLVAHNPVAQGVGDRTWTPSASAVPVSYSLGAGDATLDLGGLQAVSGADDPADVRVDMGLGSLTVVVPEGMDVRVEGQVGLGEIRHERPIPGGVELVATTTGDDRSYRTVIGEEPSDIVVRAEVGLGEIIIEER